MNLVRQKLREEVAVALQSQPFIKLTDLDLATTTYIVNELRCCVLYEEATGDATFALVLDKSTAPVGRKWPCVTVLRKNGVRFLDLRTAEEMKEPVKRIHTKVTAVPTQVNMPKEDEVEESLKSFMQDNGKGRRGSRRAGYKY